MVDSTTVWDECDRLTRLLSTDAKTGPVLIVELIAILLPHSLPHSSNCGQTSNHPTKMTTIAQARTLLEEQIAVAEQHLFQLKQQLAELESCATPSAAAPLLHPSLDPAHDRETQVSDTPQEKPVSNWPLLQDEYRRYGRQMIVDQIGLTGISYHFVCCLSRSSGRVN